MGDHESLRFGDPILIGYHKLGNLDHGDLRSAGVVFPVITVQNWDLRTLDIQIHGHGLPQKIPFAKLLHRDGRNVGYVLLLQVRSKIHLKLFEFRINGGGAIIIQFRKVARTRLRGQWLR